MPEIEVIDCVVRLGTAAIAGAFLGLEREVHGRAAGLRTVILVCVSAAAAMILSEGLVGEVPQTGAWRPDPARLAAGVLTGIGFIGAGAIVRQGHLVRGVTTAAVIWIAAISGLCCGAGWPWLGLGTAAVGVCTLALLPVLEKLADNDWYADLVLEHEGQRLEGEAFSKELLAFGVRVKRVSIESDLVANQHIMRFSLKLKRSCHDGSRNAIMDYASSLSGIRRVEWIS